MEIKTGECSGYYIGVVSAPLDILISAFGAYVGIQELVSNSSTKGELLFFFFISILSFILGICCAKTTYSMRYIGKSVLYIDSEKLVGSYKGQVYFTATWEELSHVGIFVVNRDRVGATFIYFTKKPLGFEALPRRKQLKAIWATPFDNDFIFCSISWRKWIPKILEYIPPETKVRYMNGRFIQEGKKWTYVPY